MAASLDYRFRRRRGRGASRSHHAPRDAAAVRPPQADHAPRDEALSRPIRGGFTLVELLAVILIISMLVGLVSVAAFAALRKARVSRTLLEIENIGLSINRYKEERGGAAPVCFGYLDDTSTAVEEHEALIMRHIRTAWPRYIHDTDMDGVQEYDDFVTDVATAGVEIGYDGTAAPFLDVGDLDQAEALPFFLAGFPSLAVESRTIGFSLNSANPFEGPITQPQRSQRMFEFDPQRLVDRDEDGWWEYIPQGTAPTGDMAPYVYFDANSYNISLTTAGDILLSSFPYDAGGVVKGGGASYITQWGVTWPWLREPDHEAPAGTPADWANSDSYQIICAGADGLYGPAGFEKAFPNRYDPDVPVFPHGEFLDEEHDNLANFGEDTFRAEQEKDLE